MHDYHLYRLHYNKYNQTENEFQAENWNLLFKPHKRQNASALFHLLACGPVRPFADSFAGGFANIEFQIFITNSKRFTTALLINQQAQR